jgi:hypothetical protein
MYQMELRRLLSSSMCMEKNEHIFGDVGRDFVFCIFIFKYFY